MFDINANTRIRDITDGTSSTIRHRRSRDVSLDPDAEVDDLSRPLLPRSPRLAVPGTGRGSLALGVPAICGGAAQPGLGSGPHQRRVREQHEQLGIAAQFVLTAGNGGCTMEQLNKNPVTDTFADLGGPPGGTGPAFVTSAFNTCLSTWASGAGGPPISLSLTGEGNASNGKPNPAPLAATNPEIGSISNFRSDHPNGGLFLLCDGSVQFLNDSIDMSIYTGLSTMQGGETVSRLCRRTVSVLLCGLSSRKIGGLPTIVLAACPFLRFLRAGDASPLVQQVTVSTGRVTCALGN